MTTFSLPSCTARAIDFLAQRLPRVGARVVDIDELDRLSKAYVQLVGFLPTAPFVRDEAIAYWENMIALLDGMLETLDILTLRVRDDQALDRIEIIRVDVTHHIDHARAARKDLARIRR